MKNVWIEMVYNRVPRDWWTALIGRFVSPGDALEIRCWREETEETATASRYGVPTEEGNEISVHGTVTADLIDELLADAPEDREIYNKMTKYFTIIVEGAGRHLGSYHYGTQMDLTCSDEDLAFVLDTLRPYGDSFVV